MDYTRPFPIAADQLSKNIEHWGDAGPKPISLYVSIPFCRTKCHFCDWVRGIPAGRLRDLGDLQKRYVTKLITQIEYWGPRLSELGYFPAVMYWGGGTPTRIPSRDLIAISDAIRASFGKLDELTQWTVESTPDNLSTETIEVLTRLGVNRVSVGVQSFDPRQLRVSGRGHGSDDAVEAIRRLARSKIETFNLDLISGFPGESLATLRKSVETAIGLEPPHVSIYAYRPTPNTVMAKQLGVQDTIASQIQHGVECYELAAALLRSAGYREYCHSYWVRDAADENGDVHFNYGMKGERMAFGSGAESTIGGHVVVSRAEDFDQYLLDPLIYGFAQRFSPSQPRLLEPYLGGALMRDEGIVFDRFDKLTGFAFRQFEDTLDGQHFLHSLERAGARLERNRQALWIEASTRSRAYVGYMLGTSIPQLQAEHLYELKAKHPGADGASR